MWQVLTAQSLPTTFKAADLLASLGNESNRIKSLIGECLNTAWPSKRPQASEVAARLLDEYNDSSARGKDPDDGILELLSRSRKLVDDRRRNHSTPVKEKFMKNDIKALVDLRDSWDEPDSNLRLAPEVSFLLGAGIYWGLIDVNDAQVPFSVVGRGTGPRDGISL